MSKYIIKKLDKKKFVLFENASENVIKVFDDWSKARDMSRFLSKGGGFDGWTPAFLLDNRGQILDVKI
jgi:hypothetical protein